jgi:hypothetical protein
MIVQRFVYYKEDMRSEQWEKLDLFILRARPSKKPSSEDSPLPKILST